MKKINDFLKKIPHPKRPLKGSRQKAIKNLEVIHHKKTSKKHKNLLNFFKYVLRHLSVPDYIKQIEQLYENYLFLYKRIDKTFKRQFHKKLRSCKQSLNNRIYPTTQYNELEALVIEHYAKVHNCINEFDKKVAKYKSYLKKH